MIREQDVNFLNSVPFSENDNILPDDTMGLLALGSAFVAFMSGYLDPDYQGIVHYGPPSDQDNTAKPIPFFSTSPIVCPEIGTHLRHSTTR